MKHTHLLVWILAAWLALSALAAAGELRAGCAAVNITPPVGIPMAGYYSIRKAEGTHDELMAKALVLESGGEQLALVACDLVGIDRPIIEEARRLISAQTRIPAERVMISATHSHTGPLLNELFLAAADEPARRIAERYREQLPGKIAQSVKQAAGRLATAQVSAATGHEDSIAFYRRYLMKDGTVRFNPGKLNPDIVRPVGAIDRDVQVLYFEGSKVQGSTANVQQRVGSLATYVNYAMHLDTTGGTQFSADYPYTLGKLLARIKSPEMETMFTIGAAGNINHIDVRTKARQQGFEEAERIGTVLAGEVLKTYSRLEPIEAAPLRARAAFVLLELPRFTEEQVAAARQAAAAFGQPKQDFMGMVQAMKVLDVAEHEGRPIQAEVQVMAVGNHTAWVGLPGEVFVELGRAIKERSPFPQTIIVELANGSIGYIPDRKGFNEGAYEAVNARFAPGGGEKLVGAALRLLNELRSGL
jgi:neutral ceramidase